MKQPMIDTMLREKFDNLYTPMEALDPLEKYLSQGKAKYWECCDDGRSNISKWLKQKGHEVISTDINTGFDFLNDVMGIDWDILVTNPPYSLKNRFLKTCYSYQKPFALLLPLTALEGKERGKLYKEFGISVIVLDSRLDFTGKGANWFATAWFCWNLPELENNKLVFEQIKKENK